MHKATVVISRKGVLWYRTGHTWIYRDDIADTGNSAGGDIVTVRDNKGRFLGKALYSNKSKIALRILTREDEIINEAFLARRITRAIELRRKRIATHEAVRLVYSEGDMLPGLIADKYADWIVLQTLVPGINRLLPLIAGIFYQTLKPRGIVCRNDATARALEDLPREKKMLIGKQPPLLEIKEHGVLFLIDLWNGHKTGMYLDQTENRLTVKQYARGNVLDCFSYQGHFAINVAGAADKVTAVESSAEAVSFIDKNRVLNKLDNIMPVQENAFDYLRRSHKENVRFDTIILDPPPLARRKSHLDGALRAYKEINLRSMHILSPGGVLATFCCSHSISHDLFLTVLREAAADAGATCRLLHPLTQAPDHPVLLNVPETAYLNGFIIQKVT
jgi:23S rRNA (cytosine1962-C5)-methyltransferase